MWHCLLLATNGYWNKTSIVDVVALVPKPKAAYCEYLHWLMQKTKTGMVAVHFDLLISQNNK